MSKRFSIVTVIFMAVFLQACASSKALHYKDGTEVHVVHCTGASWIGCLEQASTICKSNGYDVVEKSTAKTSGFFSSTDNKELIIRCKTPAPTPVIPAVNPNPGPITAPSGAIIVPAGAPSANTTVDPANPSTETTSPATAKAPSVEASGSPANPEAKAQ